MFFLKDKQFIRFIIKFLVVFLLCYFGTLAVIGLTAPEGYYSKFISQYLDYVSWIKNSLIEGTRLLLSFFSIDTYRAPDFIVRIVNGRGVKIAMDCVGYGVMSFWIAYVTASFAGFSKKILWILAGIILIWIINVSRITLLLVALNKQWSMPLGLDHHTWFNVVAYIAIFIMIFFFERSIKTFKDVNSFKLNNIHDNNRD
ncbi:MAG: hypothetical protein WKF35_11860 [Ferruginibacter sp.]